LFLTYIQDPVPDPHSFEKLDPDPHSPKKLYPDPDPHKVNADPKHCSQHCQNISKKLFGNSGKSSKITITPALGEILYTKIVP
jgi:hypothetical protein